MPKTGENIHKRKDGRWEGRIKKENSSNGATKYISVYAKTYREVKEKMLAVRMQKAKTAGSEQQKCFSVILQLWLENNSIRHKEATKLRYRFIIEKHINPVLGEMNVNDMNETVINQFLNMKLKQGRLDGIGGLSPAYVKTMALIIQSAMQFAAAKNYCGYFKTCIYKPPENKKDLPVLEKEVQLRLENFLKSNLSLTGLGILISLNAGLRIGEICALKWEHIDLNKKLIYVRNTIARVMSPAADNSFTTCLAVDRPKTRTSIRDIPISSKLFPALQEMKASASSEYVISDKSTFVSPRTFEYRFHRQLDLLGIPSVNFHALRHTFATRCIEMGVDAKTLSEFLGHANVSITLNTYVHPSMDLKRQQMEKLAGFSV